MNESQAICLASTPQKVGRRKLLEFIQLDLDFEYDESLRSNIHADLLYDAFTLAVVKGFTWRDVCQTVNVTEKLLQELVGKGITDAASIYQDIVTKARIDNRNLIIFTDYFFSTFMQHYKLYQLVFQTPRQVTNYNDSTVVEAPVPPQQLRFSKPPALYEYDQKLKEIQADKSDLREIRPIETVRVNIEDDVRSCPQTAVLDKIITQVMQKVGIPLADGLTETITATYDDLNMKLNETVLPRPKQLGPPLRYPLKPTLNTPKPTAGSTKTPAQKSSAKGDRKKSGKVK
ncbi:uncharacterized protein C8orf74 homolog [Watersipora subatra]|uniref:uncharacterized protein C8orf74 homolog n=1 Tax=Watersipora subatra TaxID=2589382 RepID=UPI00355BBE16